MGWLLLPTYCIHTYPLRIHVIQVILNKLYAGSKVCLVELIWYIPAQGAKLSSLLNNSVQEGHCIEQRSPLEHSGIVQLLLRYSNIRPLQASLHTLGWLVGEFNACLQIKEHHCIIRDFYVRREQIGISKINFGG